MSGRAIAPWKSPPISEVEQVSLGVVRAAPLVHLDAETGCFLLLRIAQLTEQRWSEMHLAFTLGVRPYRLHVLEPVGLEPAAPNLFLLKVAIAGAHRKPRPCILLIGSADS
jgi:hypothetical protein